MGIMSIVKNVIEHFRKAGKTENEISGMIEQAADRATVNKGVNGHVFGCNRAAKLGACTNRHDGFAGRSV